MTENVPPEKDPAMGIKVDQEDLEAIAEATLSMLEEGEAVLVDNSDNTVTIVPNEE